MDNSRTIIKTIDMAIERLIAGEPVKDEVMRYIILLSQVSHYEGYNEHKTYSQILSKNNISEL